jgi:segregation and condensation protein B
MNLIQKIESYLFYTGESIEIKSLAKIFEVTEDQINNAVLDLEQLLSGHGMVLVKNGSEVLLATHPEMSSLISEIKKQELSDPLSKSAMETLTIILYKDGATKPEIDFIRGVNSGFMLRNLLVRGLIEKIPNDTDKRITKYRTTFDTLQYLGITAVSELPHFETFKQEIEKREQTEPVVEGNIFTK